MATARSSGCGLDCADEEHRRPVEVSLTVLRPIRTLPRESAGMEALGDSGGGASCDHLDAILNGHR
jgi:hypothetical protein